MLEIKVLGPGCANCRKLEELVRAALATTGIQACWRRPKTDHLTG